MYNGLYYPGYAPKMQYLLREKKWWVLDFANSRSFQERHAIARARAPTCAKVFRRVINRTRKWNFLRHAFPTYSPVFDQDMWLYYMRLKEHFFSSVFFRFRLMLTIHEKKVFDWFAWLVSKYKNSFLVFVKICVANIRFEFRSSQQNCSINKAVLRNIAIFNLLLNRGLSLIVKIIKVTLLSIFILTAIDST